MNVNKKIYSVKRPSHPDDKQTKAKRYFKRLGRKRARKYIKKLLGGTNYEKEIR